MRDARLEAMTVAATYPARGTTPRPPVLADAPGVIPDLIADLVAGPLRREVALDLLRTHLGRIQGRVQDSFETQELSGLAAARWLAALTDGLMVAIHSYALAMVPPRGAAEEAEAPFALVATGGYGRGVLAPYSDIDLLFLTDQQAGPRTQRVVEFILYLLWDLGLKVGHATRSIRDCMEEAARDSTVLTALVDARFLVGDRQVQDRFLVVFDKARTERGLGPFLAAKRAERIARHTRYGDSPFLVEPHVKEGRGGLRDLQTLYWLARYAFGTQRMPELVGAESPGGGLLTEHEARAIRRAWNFLWTVRFHLHYVAGRAEERLTFDFQPVVGARMGYTPRGRQDGVERFMKHLFLTVRDVLRLTRVLEPAIERAALGPPAVRRQGDAGLAEAGLALADGKLVAAPPNRDFAREPVLMLRIIKAARDRKLEIHPLAIRALIRNAYHAGSLRGQAEASTLFLDLLTGRDAALWLRLMNETGFLSRYMPDWARIVGLMQFDTYHVFTVDEHTIEAIGVLQQIERGELGEVAPVASELIGQLQSRRALYVAALLHDIAKGRGGDHSELGARIAPRSCPKIGLTSEETETVSWLVLHHLLVSQTAFKRDIEDPKTILDIAETRAIPGTAAAAAGADGRATCARSGRRSGTAGRPPCCAKSTGASRKCWPAGFACRSATPAWPAPAIAAAAHAGILAGGGTGELPLARLPRLLAVLRCRDPCPPRRAHPRGGGGGGAAHRPHPGDRGARRHRDHGLCRRPPRAVQHASPARWRWPAPPSSMPASTP